MARGPCRGDAEPQGRLREPRELAHLDGVKQRHRRRHRCGIARDDEALRALDCLELPVSAVRADARRSRMERLGRGQ
jgi:hypothetical protein